MSLSRVNRERISCRVKFYKSKVDYLKECSASTWWEEVSPADRGTKKHVYLPYQGAIGLF